MAVVLPKVKQPVSKLRQVWTADGFDVVEVIVGSIPVTRIHET